MRSDLNLEATLKELDDLKAALDEHAIGATTTFYFTREKGENKS